jgi:hypothetical protein
MREREREREDFFWSPNIKEFDKRKRGRRKMGAFLASFRTLIVRNENYCLEERGT